MCLKKRRRKKEPAWIKASKKWILSLSCLLQTESIPSVPVDFCLQTLCMKLAGSNFFLTYEDFCGRFLITQSLPVPFFSFFFFKSGNQLQFQDHQDQCTVAQKADVLWPSLPWWAVRELCMKSFLEAQEDNAFKSPSSSQYKSNVPLVKQCQWHCYNKD